MSKLQDFTGQFFISTNLHASEMRGNPEKFATILNKDKKLKKMFREAVEEVKNAPTDPASGLNSLFG